MIRQVSPEFFQIVNIGLEITSFNNLISNLKELLSVKNENFKYQIKRLEKLGKFIPQYLYFEKIIFLSKKNQFGIGFLKIVKDFLKKNFLTYKIKYKCPRIKNYKIDKEFFDRDYQFEATKNFIKNNGFGIYKIPTGSGKTFMGIAAIKTIMDNDSSIRTLYLVKSLSALKTDVCNEIDKFLSCQIYQILDGNFNIDPNKEIYLMTIQTLSSLVKKWKKRKLSEDKKTDFEFFLKKIGFIIVDESHSFGTKLRKKILSLFSNAYFRLFLSATPYKNTKLDKYNIIETQNKILYSIPEEKLIKEEYLSERKIFFLECYSPNITDRKFRTMKDFTHWWDNYIIFDEKRLSIVKQVAKLLEKFQLKGIFLVKKISHGIFLSKKLGLPFINGSTSIEERNKVINDLIQYNHNFIASGIFNESINIPDFQVFINLAGGKDQNLQIQRKGRVIRKSKIANSKLYIDIADFNNRYLEDHTYNRLLAIEKTVKKEDIKVFPVEKLEKNLINLFNLNNKK